MTWEGPLVTVLLGLTFTYLVLLALLWGYARRHPDVVSFHEALRMVPELLSLLKRLIVDDHIGPRARVMVFLLLLYLASPLDLVPDFIPVIGFADDVLVVAWVLRCLIKLAGPAALKRNWSGSDVGLHLIERLAGLSGPQNSAPQGSRPNS